jgi:hypothetical protein
MKSRLPLFVSLSERFYSLDDGCWHRQFPELFASDASSRPEAQQRVAALEVGLGA